MIHVCLQQHTLPAESLSRPHAAASSHLEAGGSSLAKRRKTHASAAALSPVMTARWEHRPCSLPNIASGSHLMMQDWRISL